ncbi:hypothetical protein FRB99_001899, partial [Tulasnella sp. 403]
MSRTVKLCSLCKERVGDGAAGWAAHVAGVRHQRNLEKNASNKLGLTTFYCNPCNRNFESETSFTKHTRKKGHVNATKYSVVAANIREAQQDKYNISVSHEHNGIDFGFVDVGRISHNCPQILIQVTATSSHNRLLSVRVGTGFTAKVQTPVELTVGTTFSIPVTLAPGDLRGRLGQKLELVFENRAVQQSFTIVRPVRAILGVQADQDTLLTRVPYVRRPRRVRTGIIAPIPGPLPPSCTSIKYVMKLPEYPLDPNVIIPGSEAERMEVIRRLLPQELSAETYRRFWQTLLFVEEHQMKMDFEAYDLFDVPLRIEGAFYFIHVCLRRFPTKWFEGRVHILRDKEVGLKFASSFKYNTGDLLEARFSVGRVPMRRMHQALHCPFFPARVVFPEAEHIEDLEAPTPEDMQAVQVYNPNLATNEPQLKAVTAIVNRPPGSVPFVIFGPPGTGKTVTLVEAIRQILARNPNAHILACTPSNSAADLITQRLADLGPAQLFRMNAPSRWHSRVPQDIRPFTFTDTRGYFSVAGATQIESFRVVVSTCISAAIPYGVGVTP